MLSQFGLVPTASKTVAVGDTFGRLTVIAVGQIPDTYRYFAICECSCGSAAKAIRLDGLTSGFVVSCGCVQRERTITHGLTNSPHYYRWRNMMSRCYNETDAAYKWYGGRGISVAPEWHDITTFIAQLPDGHFAGAEIDRVDNDGDYVLGNVRWVTRQKNTDNRRTGRKVTYLGRTQSISAWAREFSMSTTLVFQRVRNFGWHIERALTTPPIAADERMAAARHARWGNHVKPARSAPRATKTVMLNGEPMTIAQLAKIAGVAPKLMRKRIFERGWPVEKALKPIED